MKPEDQRIAIAEATFFERVDDYGSSAWRDKRNHQSCVLHSFRPGGFPLPDYLNDLNAIHEAEQTLTSDDGELWRTYCRTLLEVSGRVEPLSFEDFTFAIDATAAQRAEAFLRTLGKWEEQP